jgi:hypothetical protein
MNDDTIPKLIFAAFLVWIGVVIAAVVIAVIVLLIAPATAGAPLYWLFFRRRYTLSRSKTLHCAGIAAVMFLIAYLVTMQLHPETFRYAPYWFIDWSFPAEVAAVWMGLILALSVVAVFLCAEVYQQTFWPHRRVFLGATSKNAALRTRVMALDWQLRAIQKRIHRTEKAAGALLAERQKLRGLIDHILTDGDSAFLAAERSLWQREYGNLATAAILERSKDLDAQLAIMADADPSRPTLALQATTLKLQAVENRLREHNSVSYDQLLAHRTNLSTWKTNLLENVPRLRRLAEDAQFATRQLKRTSVTIQ